MSRSVLSDTGLEEEDLDLLWSKYNVHFPRLPSDSDDKIASYFYLLCVYIHTYPRTRCLSRHLWTPRYGPISKSTFYRRVVPLALALADRLDEVHWINRLNPYNHVIDFPYRFTAIVGTVRSRSICALY